jgi:formylglycine-generating enzyme required for sulfatase activity
VRELGAGAQIEEDIVAFLPDAKQELHIESVPYWIAEHPAAPGLPYGQEGRQAVVYQLVAQEGEAQALKVFKPRYRLPALVSLADRIAPFSRLPGLQVCRRTVLAPQRHAGLLRQQPDLTYAVLMPWVEGPTWMEVVVEKRALSPEEGLALARSLAAVLVGMEQNGLAHCDISASNVLLPALVQSVAPGERPPIGLVDVEQLYGSGLRRPELLPGGSPGYAHKTAPDGLWGSTADRFAGAVLLGEFLGWCDERAREAAWGESYFDPQEMQRDSERFRTLITVLRERWGENVAGLFERAWRSDVLADCTTFGEWLVTLPEKVPKVAPHPLPEVRAEVEAVAPDASEAAVRALMAVARRLEEQRNLVGALENYRQAQTLAPPESGLAEELALIVQDLEAQQGAPVIPVPQPPLEREKEKPAVAERWLARTRRRVPGWAWVLGGLALLALSAMGGWRMLFPRRDVMIIAVVNVPAGPFLMGSDPAKDPYAEVDERPQHEVNLNAFAVGRTEVTNEQFEACVRAGVCTPSAFAQDPAYNGADYPVVGVGWENAHAYCQWAGGDLPTEAQWEKAARGTDGRIYPWGSEFDGVRANSCDAGCSLPHRTQSYYDGYEHTAPVDSFRDDASPYRAFQMAGNVWEWVLDCYDKEFYVTTTAAGTDPVSYGSECSTFVLRGGSWASDQYSIRCANRYASAPDRRTHDVGFRCVFPMDSP